MTFTRAGHQAPPEIQCHGKIRYLTRREAKLAIRRHRNPVGLCVYRCPHCSDPDAKLITFHIRHRPGGS